MLKYCKITCCSITLLLLTLVCSCVGTRNEEIIVQRARQQSQIIISEINTDKKYIELYNPSAKACDLSGMKFRKNVNGFFADSDSRGDFLVGEGSVLKGFSYAVLRCKENHEQYDCLMLGNSASGLSGKRSLLIELLDCAGNRVDYFCNSIHSNPSVVDNWDDVPEYRFDVAGRSLLAGREWFVMGVATPGYGNIESSITRKFENNVVDFTSTQPNTPTTQGKEYVFDSSAIPEIHISVETAEWNKLLRYFDNNNNTTVYIKCNLNFVKNGTTTSIEDAGFRLRGNTSRRRPEGYAGQMHQGDKTDWHHFHFGLHCTKFTKDDNNTIRGVKRLNMKWFKDDASYVRELYCYDLFRRFGVWTAVDDIYSRVWIKVQGDSRESYLGVFEMMEAINDEYIEAREEQFATDNANLWKCRYGATLYSTDNWQFGYDDDSGQEFRYELKTNTSNFSAAKAQLVDFITNVKTKSGTAFYEWIDKVCDVELLLRTYAVNVAVGMWDDYWNNTNNFYICFTGDGTTDYQFYFIPYDYDNSLGTSFGCGIQNDSGRQNPLQWGVNSTSPLIYKILQNEQYRKIYVDALNELIDPTKDLLYYSHSATRIQAWQNSIRGFVDNDTNEDTTIADRPASWGNHSEYRLLDSNNNFFKVKASSIPSK